MLFALGSVSVVESVAVVAAVVELVDAEVELLELAVELLVLVVELVVDDALSVSPSLGGGGTNMTARTSSEIFRSKALAS